jgi:hypothetical protein
MESAGPVRTGPFHSVTCMLFTRANFSGTAEATRQDAGSPKSVRLNLYL